MIKIILVVNSSKNYITAITIQKKKKIHHLKKTKVYNIGKGRHESQIIEEKGREECAKHVAVHVRVAHQWPTVKTG